MAAHWGDDEEVIEKKEEDTPRIFILPPDKDGVKIVTEIRKDDNGRPVKIVRKFKVTKKMTRLSKTVAERRGWKKFGNCEGAPPGLEPNVTYSSGETINLVLKPRKRGEEEEPSVFSALKPTDLIMTCQLCKEKGHFSLGCPKRQEIEVADKKGNIKRPAASTSSTTEAGKEPPKDGKYVLVHKREGQGKRTGSSAQDGGRERNDDATIRLTNISKETGEDDLRELCSSFGRVVRLYLARDRGTNESRGFAFITFETKESAEGAIKVLNGHGYDNLILAAEFAKPREENPDKPREEREGWEDRPRRSGPPPRDDFMPLSRAARR